MEKMIDFEELIDLNASFLSVSQKSLQGPISDILDKMCESIDESNLATDNIFKNKDTSTETINILNENNADVTPFRISSITELLDTHSIGDNETDDRVTTTNEQKNQNGERIPNDDLKEFECILAAKCLGNKCIEPKTNDITHKKKHVKNEIDESLANDDVIDLDEFERILGTDFSNNKCIEYANTENDISNVSSGNQYEVKNELNNKVPNYDAIDLDDFVSITSEEQQIKNENDETCSNENFIDLNEFIIQDIKDFIEPDNNLINSITVSVEQKYATTIVPYELPFEFEVENKDRSETVTEQTHHEILNEEKCINSDFEDGYNSSDFEFISEEEASQAGIITKFNKHTNSNNGSVNNNVKIPRTPTMPKNKTGILNSLKNEASLSDYIKYSKYRFQHCYSQNSDMTDDRAVPEGEQYLDMFRGQNAPMFMNKLYTIRNKNIMPPVLMAVNREDLMFHAHEVDEHCEEHKDDANECLNKILATYPQENRRKRRIH